MYCFCFKIKFYEVRFINKGLSGFIAINIIFNYD